MSAIAVLNIKRQLDKTHHVSEKDARILLAYLDAYEKQVEELKKKILQLETDARQREVEL